MGAGDYSDLCLIDIGKNILLQSEVEGKARCLISRRVCERECVRECVCVCARERMCVCVFVRESGEKEFFISRSSSVKLN